MVVAVAAQAHDFFAALAAKAGAAASALNAVKAGKVLLVRSKDVSTSARSATTA
jgi:hypothetical protein